MEIHQEICHKIIKEIESTGVHINYYHNNRVFCKNKTKQADEYMKLTDYITASNQESGVAKAIENLS